MVVMALVLLLLLVVVMVVTVQLQLQLQLQLQETVECPIKHPLTLHLNNNSNIYNRSQTIWMNRRSTTPIMPTSNDISVSNSKPLESITLLCNCIKDRFRGMNQRANHTNTTRACISPLQPHRQLAVPMIAL
ncbi:hypothetical protein F5H01DRAFT_329241 [Linnemannia elongata]|nr:hypothetical protein F5H01DRAFT_329241 [Linnemannia elongata]